MMVAEISNETRRMIWHSMDLVEGLHYVALWWQRRKIDLISIGDNRGSLIL